jgi:hypothetical protein
MEMNEFARDAVVSTRLPGQGASMGTVVGHGEIKVNGRDPIRYVNVKIGNVVRAIDPDELFPETF